MSQPVGADSHPRLDLEFVEADVEIGFSLVDMAGKERSLGNLPLAARLLHVAEEVFHDITQRLEQADVRERESFGPLMEELRREIDSAAGRAEGVNRLPERGEDRVE